MKLTELNTVNYGRTDGSADGHSPHSELFDDIRPKILADRYTVWSKFLIVTGFYPSDSIVETLQDLRFTFSRIGMPSDNPDHVLDCSNRPVVDEAALLQEATARGLVLDDLDELNF